MKRWNAQELAEELAKLTQTSIDRAVGYTQHPGLAMAWIGRTRDLAHILLGGDAEDRRRAAQSVVGFAFHGAEPAAFWGTPVGQLMYLAGGFPPRNPTKTEAASILQVSHQAVSDLIRRGGLIENDGKVDALSLRGRWLRRAQPWEEAQ